MTRENDIRSEAMARLMKLYKCIKVVKYKYEDMPVDDLVSEGIKRDLDIAMDTVDSSLKDNFYVCINEQDGKTVVDFIDKTTEEPTTGQRIFEVLKESVEND